MRQRQRDTTRKARAHEGSPWPETTSNGAKPLPRRVMRQRQRDTTRKARAHEGSPWPETTSNGDEEGENQKRWRRWTSSTRRRSAGGRCADSRPPPTQASKQAYILLSWAKGKNRSPVEGLLTAPLPVDSREKVATRSFGPDVLRDRRGGRREALRVAKEQRDVEVARVCRQRPARPCSIPDPPLLTQPSLQPIRHRARRGALGGAQEQR
jgi:hypothetical protein